jgi:MEMO1 family protein
MNDARLYPKLRHPIDLRIEKVEREEILLVNCPLGIAPQPLALVAAVAPLVGSFDGTSSVEEIAGRFSQYGVTKELLNELIELLDTNLYLATPRFFTVERNLRADYHKLASRAPSHAGLSYPAARDQLERFIDAYLKQEAPFEAPLPAGRLLALKAPHIDYQRGGVSYGLTYKHLRPHNHDVYVLMGTAHQFSRHMFHLTRKDFDNPLGMLPSDKALVDEIARRYGVERSFADEILHRREHSLELQLPFIRRVRELPTILPILVGGFHHMLSSEKPPGDYEEYDTFVEALAESLNDRRKAGQSICFIAGVDMAHVGRAFGDSGALTPEQMKAIESKDRLYLRHIESHDKDALFAHVAEDGDARRICGFPTMYTLLDVMERMNFRYDAVTFDYRQAVNYQTDCAVTFAGMGIYEKTLVGPA